MSVRVRKDSRLKFAKLLVVDGIEFWDRPRIPEIPPAKDDKIYAVEQGDRLDLIARKYLKNEFYDWILAHVNSLRALPNEVYEFREIRIPSMQTVRKKLVK